MTLEKSLCLCVCADCWFLHVAKTHMRKHTHSHKHQHVHIGGAWEARQTHCNNFVEGITWQEKIASVPRMLAPIVARDDHQVLLVEKTPPPAPEMA